MFNKIKINMYKFESLFNENKILFLVIIIIACLIALEGVIVMCLWNWLIVELFNAKSITWLIGCGIVILLSFISYFFK